MTIINMQVTVSIICRSISECSTYYSILTVVKWLFIILFLSHREQYRIICFFRGTVWCKILIGGGFWRFWCFPARPSKFNLSNCLRTIQRLQVYGERQWRSIKILSIKYLKSQYPSKFLPVKILHYKVLKFCEQLIFSFSQFYFHEWPSKLTWAKANQATQGNVFNLSHNYWHDLSNVGNFHDFKISYTV